MIWGNAIAPAANVVARRKARRVTGSFGFFIG
jgi:hypothetical protein